MVFVASAVSFLVALLVGGFAIYVAARLLTGTQNYVHALITAFLGAVAWAVTSWIPLIGLVLALLAWVWVIKWRFSSTWLHAIAIGVVAWLAAMVVLFVLNEIFDLGVGAFGIPGT